jgi:CheY-like chemotaxis protein
MEACLRILIVDDNHHSADTLAGLLALLGHETRAVYDASALHLARDFRPHVFIIDLAMPDIDGFTLAKEIRQQPEHNEALLIAFSGYHDTEYEARAKAAGFTCYLLKPINLAQLSSILDGERQPELLASSERAD